jgi:hypothetical protein
MKKKIIKPTNALKRLYSSDLEFIIFNFIVFLCLLFSCFCG